MVYWIYIMMHSVYTVFIALQEQCIDMNSCEFSICASHLICLTARYVANATRIHIISSFCRGWCPHQPEKTYRFYEVKISSKRSLHIDKKHWHLNYTVFIVRVSNFVENSYSTKTCALTMHIFCGTMYILKQGGNTLWQL